MFTLWSALPFDRVMSLDNQVIQTSIMENILFASNSKEKQQLLQSFYVTIQLSKARLAKTAASTKQY